MCCFVVLVVYGVRIDIEIGIEVIFGWYVWFYLFGVVFCFGFGNGVMWYLGKYVGMVVECFVYVFVGV